MMGVYIHGMEMPKDGSWVTLRVFPDGQCFLYSWCGNDLDFMEQLTAVPVPQHGRLIDADALFFNENVIGKMMVFGGEYVYTQSAIDKAKTIIPAEEEGEG